MAEIYPTASVKGISLTRKIAPTSTAGVLLGLILYLPQPYAHWLALVVSCLYFISLAATRIDAPVEGSKWCIPYKLLCFVSANFGAAANDTTQPAPSPAQPRQVVIISNSEDVAKATQQALSNKDISVMDTVNTTPTTPSTTTAASQTVATPTQDTPVSTVKKESITNLVSAGENLYETISGKKSDEAVKVISGVSTIVDVLLPALDAKIDLSIEDVIGGTTEILTGIDTVVAALKKKQA